MNRTLLRCTLAAFSLALGPSLQAGTPAALTLATDAKEFSLSGFSEDTDLSGIARAGDYVLVVADEGTSLQLGKIDMSAGTIRMESMVPLESAKKKKDGGGELDLEGACYAPAERAFYVTGSHGVGKKKGDIQPRRFGVYRIPFDPERGVLDTAGITKSSLLPWLEESADFKSSLRRPLQQSGFNIEGLAWADGRLFFGIRGPTSGEDSFLIEVAAAALFADGGRGIAPVIHRVPLGADTGIREVVAGGNSLFLLSGNASAEPSKQFPVSQSRRPDAEFGLWRLPLTKNGKPGPAERLGTVGEADGKAEGLLLLEETPAATRLLVLHDGLPQGGPVSCTLSPAP